MSAREREGVPPEDSEPVFEGEEFDANLNGIVIAGK